MGPQGARPGWRPPPRPAARAATGTPRGGPWSGGSPRDRLARSCGTAEVASMSGRVVHFEIPYDDGDRAQEFYREAFGWQLQSMPGMGYTLVTSGPTGDSGPTEAGFINGGVMSRQDSPPAAPAGVVGVGGIRDNPPPLRPLRGGDA